MQFITRKTKDVPDVKARVGGSGRLSKGYRICGPRSVDRRQPQVHPRFLFSSVSIRPLRPSVRPIAVSLSTAPAVLPFVRPLRPSVRPIVFSLPEVPSVRPYVRPSLASSLLLLLLLYVPGGYLKVPGDQVTPSYPRSSLPDTRPPILHTRASPPTATVAS